MTQLSLSHFCCCKESLTHIPVRNPNGTPDSHAGALEVPALWTVLGCLWGLGRHVCFFLPRESFIAQQLSHSLAFSVLGHGV